MAHLQRQRIEPADRGAVLPPSASPPARGRRKLPIPRLVQIGCPVHIFDTNSP